MMEICVYGALARGSKEVASHLFYVGKGAGTRAYGQDLRIDKSKKGIRIRDIPLGGYEVVVSKEAVGTQLRDRASDRNPWDPPASESRTVDCVLWT